MSRVSTEEQAADDRLSLGVQAEACRAFAERQGWTVTRAVEIRGESAYSDEIGRRPEFAAVIAAAERGEFDVLVVYDFSRFARSQRVAHDVLYRLRAVGVRCFGINGIDYTEDEDWAGIEAVFARRSSRDHSRRVRDAIDRRHKLGLPTGPIPFGYRAMLTTEPPAIVPDEAEAVRWAYLEFARTGSLMGVVEEFNRRGLRPHSKRGRVTFGETGVQRILENEFYLGMVRHHGALREGRHDAILAVEEWEAAQARKRSGHRSPRGSALLSGLATCLWCGRGLHHQASRSGRMYYRERNAEGCSYRWGTKAFPADDAEAKVGEVVAALDDGEWLAWCDRQARKPVSDASRDRRKVLEEQLRRAGHALVMGTLDEREHDVVAMRVRREIGALPVLVEGVQFRGTKLADFGAVWRFMTEGERREVVKEVLRGVRMDMTNRELWLEPWPEYEPLFTLRRDFVALGVKAESDEVEMVRLGGAEVAAPTSLYLAEELVA
jgi:DNA invertase Pin-like site-specific DNA recombinase